MMQATRATLDVQLQLDQSKEHKENYTIELVLWGSGGMQGPLSHKQKRL